MAKAHIDCSKGVNDTTLLAACLDTVEGNNVEHALGVLHKSIFGVTRGNKQVPVRRIASKPTSSKYLCIAVKPSLAALEPYTGGSRNVLLGSDVLNTLFKEMYSPTLVMWNVLPDWVVTKTKVIFCEVFNALVKLKSKIKKKSKNGMDEVYPANGEVAYSYIFNVVATLMCLDSQGIREFSCSSLPMMSNTSESSSNADVLGELQRGMAINPAAIRDFNERTPPALVLSTAFGIGMLRVLTGVSKAPKNRISPMVVQKCGYGIDGEDETLKVSIVIGSGSAEENDNGSESGVANSVRRDSNILNSGLKDSFGMSSSDILQELTIAPPDRGISSKSDHGIRGSIMSRESSYPDRRISSQSERDTRGSIITRESSYPDHSIRSQSDRDPRGSIITRESSYPERDTRGSIITRESSQSDHAVLSPDRSINSKSDPGFRRSSVTRQSFQSNLGIMSSRISRESFQSEHGISGNSIQREDSLFQYDYVAQMETNLDDISGENLAFTMDLLMQHGAIDVWATPIIMKKGRPAHTLHCLCMDNDESNVGGDNGNENSTLNDLLQLIFIHTTTLGVRINRKIPRAKLDRSIVTVTTLFKKTLRKGNVDIKISKLKNGFVVTKKPEFEHCKEIAMEMGVGICVVADQANYAYANMNKN